MKKYFTTLIITLSIFLSHNSFANLPEKRMREIIQMEEGKYSGISEEGISLIKKSRDILRNRKETFSKKFKQFESIYHAAHVTRLIKGNMFLYGPPGGAKSLFIDWVLDNEDSEAFRIQMNQMMSEQVFVGGQNFEAAKKGRYEVNVEGSLADYKIAIIDEINTGNPAALSSLLSLLNERKVLMGSKVFESTFETIFTTSNANLYEFYEEFERNGISTTAGALFNRFTSIAYVPNWLGITEQRDLDNAYLDELDCFFYTFNGCNKDETLDLELDWEGIRALAYVLFRPSKEFQISFRNWISTLKDKAEDFLRNQEDQYEVDALPYYPTVQFAERLREKITDVVLMSLTLDFLESPLTDHIDTIVETLKNSKYNRFEVSPLSLWRAYSILTTVSYGKTNLVFPEDNNSEIEIDFDDFFESFKAPDKRTEHMIKHISDEKIRFSSSFSEMIKNNQQQMSKTSSYSALASCFTDELKIGEIHDIERLIIALNKKKMKKSSNTQKHTDTDFEEIVVKK